MSTIASTKRLNALADIGMSLAKRPMSTIASTKRLDDLTPPKISIAWEWVDPLKARVSGYQFSKKQSNQRAAIAATL